MKNLAKIAGFGFASVFLLSACTQEAKPDETLGKFYNAVAHKNFEEAEKFCTTESAGSLADIKKSSDAMNKPVDEQVANLKKLKYGKIEVKGDSAFVDLTNDKVTKPMVYTLVKKNGVWLVDLSPSSMHRLMKNQK